MVLYLKFKIQYKDLLKNSSNLLKMLSLWLKKKCLFDDVSLQGFSTEFAYNRNFTYGSE